MSFKSLLNNQKFTAVDGGVDGNGTFNLWSSGILSAPQDYNAADTGFEVIVTYDNNLPDPEVTNAKYSLSCIIETQDEGGNWHPIHNQFRPYVKEEQGNKFIMRMDPSILNLDPGVPVDIWDGVRNIAIECLKQGRLPDDFRVCVQVNEAGHDAAGLPTASSFQEVDVTISYRTYQQ